MMKKTDRAHDFDFLMGRWTIRNRYLRERLEGSTAWVEFESTCVARPLLNGGANEDEYRTSHWPGFVGMSFRFFNPATEQWAIYWADSRRGVLDPPVFGSFTGDTGIFEGTDAFEGRPVRVRFTWSRVTTTTPRWEQAFSDDGGVTWETNWVMDFRRDRECCAVVELRQYTMKPGRRDDLIALFEQHFIESQEAAGMTVLGQFRDRRRPDRFVWLRAFPDMPSRHAALHGFYDGPVWAAHREAANATMLDSDDVHLLRPIGGNTGFRLNVSDRPAAGEGRAGDVVLAAIHPLPQPADAFLQSQFERDLMPRLREHGVRIEAMFVTESSPNTYTQLPVREGEHVLVWFGALERRELPSPDWTMQLASALVVPGHEPPMVMELEPTPRSLLGHHRTKK